MSGLPDFPDVFFGGGGGSRRHRRDRHQSGLCGGTPRGWRRRVGRRDCLADRCGICERRSRRGSEQQSERQCAAAGRKFPAESSSVHFILRLLFVRCGGARITVVKARGLVALNRRRGPSDRRAPIAEGLEFSFGDRRCGGRQAIAGFAQNRVPFCLLVPFRIVHKFWLLVFVVRAFTVRSRFAGNRTQGSYRTLSGQLQF